MKKVLALLAALFMVSSVSNASIFKCWLVPGTVNSSGFYSVAIWGEILPDPAIPGEDVTDSGFSDFAVTIYSPGTNVATAPRTNTAGTSVITSFTGSPFADWGTKINPSAADYEGDGDKDAVELAVGDTDGLDITIGTAGAVLIATETWKNLAGGTVTLTPYIANTSRHWNSDGITRSDFTGYQAVSSTFDLPPSGPAAPVISVTPSTTRINTASAAVSNANVTFTTTKVSGGDPTAGTINNGTGAVALTTPTLPSTDTLAFDIGSNNSQDFTVTVNASNTGGSDTKTASVTVLRAPEIVALVNGVAVTNGQTLSGPEFYGHNMVTISLVNSLGYIEDWSIVNAASTLNVTGSVLSGATWTGDVYNLYDNNLGVTLRVQNTGTGANAQSITLHFVPEPATMALLGLGGLAALLRRKHA